MIKLKDFKFYNLKSPCKDCPAKGCGAMHDLCEKYLKYRNKIYQARYTMRQQEALKRRERDGI